MILRVGGTDHAVRDCLEIRARRLVQDYRAVLHHVRATMQFISFQLSAPSSHPACNSVLLAFSLPNCQFGTECKMLSVCPSFALQHVYHLFISGLLSWWFPVLLHVISGTQSGFIINGFKHLQNSRLLVQNKHEADRSWQLISKKFQRIQPGSSMISLI